MANEHVYELLLVGGGPQCLTALARLLESKPDASIDKTYETSSIGSGSYVQILFTGACLAGCAPNLRCIIIIPAIMRIMLLCLSAHRSRLTSCSW